MYPLQNSLSGGEPYGKKIFVTHKPSYELTPESPAVEILFRIEKVSSKIGLFKLYIEPDYGDGSLGPIGGVFTDNIEVKSKVNDKAKAQYIDSIQNILVPVTGHTGPPMQAVMSVPQAVGGGRAAAEHAHAGHGVRGGASLHAGAHAPASALHAGSGGPHGGSGHGAVDHHHHLGGGGAYATSPVPVPPVRAHSYHVGGGRADGGGGSATGERRCTQ